LLVPEDLHELVSPDRSQAVEGEEREEESALLSGKRPLDATAVEVDDELSTKLDSRSSVIRQRRSNVAPWAKDHNVVQAKGGAMAKIINCECGYVVRGETDDELVENALAHLERDHPELIGKRSAEDILAAAEEA
jgi:hypothetical protein